jgi:hypothetical protein
MTNHIKIGNVMPRVQFIGNGITTQFVYPFAIFHEEDLEVYLNDIKQSSGFSVSGAGDSVGGVVTFSTAPGASVIVTLRRSLAIQRITDFQESGDFRAKALNDELDYQTAALQDLAVGLAASVRAAPTDQAANLVLPNKAERAGKILGFNQDGGVEARASLAAGTSEHGQLNGLQSDDHPQYLTGARADAWLGAKTADDLAEGITNTYMRLAGSGTNMTAARADHHHAGVYEPAFPKNTAFNKNFGAGSDEVAPGDHTHAFDLNAFALGDLGNVTEAGRAEGYALTWSAATAQWEPRPQAGGGGTSGRFGLRNLITNAAFRINQRRNFSSVLAAGVYGYDRWRGGPSGCTYAVSGNTATITAGSLVQTINGANVTEAGPYALSWEGTATATLNGNPVINGGQVTLVPFANVVVAFAGGTLIKPQLEQNPMPTPFEQRSHELELQLCLPYYQKSYSLDVAPGAIASSYNDWAECCAHTAGLFAQTTWQFTTPMRRKPALGIYSISTGAPDSVTRRDYASDAQVAAEAGEKSFVLWAQTAVFAPGERLAFHWTADAEF